MNNSWEVKKLGEVCEIVNGGTPKTSVLEYWGNSNCWITPAEMGKRSSPYIYNTVRKLSELGLQNSSARLLPANSVILSSRAPIGHLVVNTCLMATNQGCKGLIPSGRIHYKYLYYYLSSIITLLNTLGTGTTFKELSGSKLKEVTIPLPPLSEQQRIVVILDGAFAAIAKAKANAEKNLQNSREVFESYLQSIFSNPDDDWVEKKMGEVFDFKNGRSFKKSEWKNIGLSIIRIQNLNNKNLGFNCFQGEYNKDIEVNKGDLLFSWSGTIGTSFGAHIWDRDKGLLNQHIYKVVFKQRVDVLYAYYFFRYITSEIEKRTNGAVGLVHVTKTTLNNFKILLPSFAKQQLIATKFDDLSIKTKKLEAIYRQKLLDLEELKKALLQKAFSGQLTKGDKDE